MQDFKYIQIAKEIMSLAHRGQTRSKNNATYETHPVRVAAMAAELGFPTYAIIAMLWHDVLEDGSGLVNQNANFLIDWSIDRGIPYDITVDAVNLVCILTKFNGESRNDYFTKIGDSKNEYAIIGKILDRIDNLREGSQTQSDKWLSRYLRGCRSVLQIAYCGGYADAAPVIYLREQIEDVERKLQSAEAVNSAE